MQIIVNNTACEVPFDTSIITLDQFMQYHDEYGRDLYKLLQELRKQKFDDEVEKIIAYDDYMNQEALAWFFILDKERSL